MRLDRAEREAKGDFSKSDPSEVGTSSAASSTAASSSSSSAAATKLAKENEDDSWKKYKRPEDDDDLTPAAILNKQHSNLRAQAKVDQVRQHKRTGGERRAMMSHTSSFFSF